MFEKKNFCWKPALAILGLVASMAGASAAPSGTLTVVVPNFGRELLDLGKTSTQDLQYTGHINEPLIGTAPDGKLAAERGLAESWAMDEDAKTFTVVLRRDVKWHDGKPFTADDVVFSLSARYVAKDAVCTFCRLLQAISEVKAEGDHKVRITLKEPDPSFLAVLSARDGDIRILPRHNYRATAEGFEMVGKPIGTGPWKFSSFDRGIDMKLSANTAYWDASRIPDFETMRLIPRSQASTRLSMVRAGEADMAFVDPRQVNDARAAGLRVLTSKGSSKGNLSFYGCWQEQMLCHQQAFREALVSAIDMDVIVKSIYPEGTAERLATVYWTEGSLGYDPALKPYKYDPKRAAQLLSEIGYKGTPVKLWSVRTNAMPEAPEIMELVDGYLRAAGFKTEVTPMEFGAFRPRYASTPQRWETNYAAHLYLDAGAPRPTVIPALRVGVISQQLGGLIQGYWNLPKIDAVWKKLITLKSLEELDESLRELNRELYGEYNSNPVALRYEVAVVGPKIQGWTPSSFGLAWHLETVKKTKQ
jgi:peptide/nickel transport system substrate-binding protein